MCTQSIFFSSANKEYYKDVEEKGRIDDIKSVTGKKLSYPKRIFFIIASEFCEKFNYYGMKSKIHFRMFALLSTSKF